jgi:hypothetical protein
MDTHNGQRPSVSFVKSRYSILERITLEPCIGVLFKNSLSHFNLREGGGNWLRQLNGSAELRPPAMLPGLNSVTPRDLDR